MAYTAQNIIDAALLLLEDTEQNRFTSNILLTFINEGVTNIIKDVPNANVVYSVKALVDGPMQTLDSKNLYLLDVMYNTNATGTVQGKIPLRTQKATLDFSNPTWTQSLKRAYAQYYTYDSENTRVFFVYPPNDGTGYVYLKTADIPTAITVATNTIPLRDEHEQPLIYYVVMKAYMMDTDTANIDKVQLYQSLYNTTMGLYKQATAKEDAKNAG